ncbi:hypothetical protein SAY87_018966 [Trapa incisa]|uniref:Preprotein translocase subunit SECE1 n=1 Tax=Trapa incisa TaxID=236973 RepID=A0AAN7JZ37_9MYRT|nr:hypothetical protein SAY87_018966 [Trapa incisa]
MDPPTTLQKFEKKPNNGFYIKPYPFPFFVFECSQAEMALPISLRLPATPDLRSPPEQPRRFRTFPQVSLTSTLRFSGPRARLSTTFRAIEKGRESAERETAETPGSDPGETSGPPPEPSNGAELSEIGREIKKAMEQRKEKAESDLLSGVGEEVREIEWPAFGKVLGTTGVVLGVIAGSSVALLTVNAVLAELSDKVFAGKGIQDFFG